MFRLLAAHGFEINPPCRRRLCRPIPTDSPPRSAASTRETRVLEDALCLVFLERQFAALAGKTSDDKMISALQKSWAKMTPAAREAALQLSYGNPEKKLLKLALETAGNVV